MGVLTIYLLPGTLGSEQKRNFKCLERPGATIPKRQRRVLFFLLFVWILCCDLLEHGCERGNKIIRPDVVFAFKEGNIYMLSPGVGLPIMSVSVIPSYAQFSSLALCL